MKAFTILTIFLSILFFYACEDGGVDVTAPAMKIERYAPTPVAGTICGTIEDSVFNLVSGAQLDFEVKFVDDGALSQYKIDIHNNFDCHGHGGASAPGVAVPNVSNQTEDWTLLDIVSLAGQEVAIERSLKVPENVTAGNYHFQLQVLDESGNDNPLANFYSLKILNSRDTMPPTLMATVPIGNFTANKGEQVNFQGTVADNYSLSEGGNGLLFLSYTSLNSGNTFTSDAVFPFDNSVDKDYSFDFDFTIPSTLSSGAYLFTLRAHDGVRNVAEPATFEVQVE